MASGGGLAPAEAKNISEGPLDLRVKELPQRELHSLQMRELKSSQVRTAARDDADASVSAPAAKPKNSRLHYRPIPTEYRDLRERIIFKTNVGYGLDATQLSGNVSQNGIAPADVTDVNGNAYADQRQYLLGDAIVGSRGILRPSLNTYFLSRFQFDAGGGEFTALNTVYDSQDSQALLIRAGYAELDGLGGPEGGVLDSVYIRAGRQYRFGSNRFVANFDGVTAAYDHRVAEVSGFFGQRVSLFFDDDPGTVAGAGLKLRGEELIGYPVDVNVDALQYDSGGDLPPRIVIEGRSQVRVADDTRLYFRGRFLDDGSGGDNASGVGRVGGQMRQSLGDDFLVVLDVEKNFAREFAFDYIGASPIDVVNVSQELGLAIGTPQNSTLLGARANYQLTDTVEAYGFYRNRLVKNKDQADAFSRPFQEFGVASSALIGDRLSATGQYKYRVHDLEGGGAVGVGSAFDDTAGAGVKEMHELSTEARYNFGKKKADAAVGAYMRLYDVETAYALLDNDALGGGRFDAGYWPTEIIRLRVAGEVAQPSQTMSADIDTLVSLRLLMEASF